MLWWLTTNWLTEKSNSNFFLFSIFSVFCIEIDELFERWLNAKNVVWFSIDEMIAIALNTFDLISKIFSIFYFHFITIFNAQLNRTTICEMLCKDIVLLHNYTRISKWEANTWKSAKTYVKDLIINESRLCHSMW